MLIGTHNSLTGSKIYGWQRYFSWLISPFSKCQDYSLLQQYNKGIRIYDIQVAKHKNTWRASHGFVWYQSTIDALYEVLDMAEDDDNLIGIRIGLDNHWRFSKFSKEAEKLEFLDLVDKLSKHPNLRILEVYIEKPWDIIYRTPGYDKEVFEKYWSLSWAKTKMKHWWQFYYYLPIPVLWASIYFNEWYREAIKADRNIFITDFI